MGRPDRRSTRLLFDLQATQTRGSAQRGVGRYSHALFCAVTRHARADETHALLADTLPRTRQPLAVAENRVWTLPALPEWRTPRSYASGEQDDLDGIAYSAFVQQLKPDVVHVAHVFEGFDERVPLPHVAHRAPGQLFSATLYDLIPLRFREHYFQNAEVKAWYLARTMWLRKADLLLAISEASRQDAIELLGIEPWRIVTINGGISDHFKPPVDREIARRHVRDQFGLGERFVLYTGGDDHRKNLAGAIRAFAAVPAERRRGVRLVIVCSMEDHRRAMFLDLVRACGLGTDEVLLTGFVAEDDLVALYGACDLFVFPSLYEGLGLPVLEAMACGAPVIGGDNSSIREIIGREDALFSASSVESIAARMTQGLSDPGFADDLRRHSALRIDGYTWDNTAQRALDAIDEALARVQSAGPSVAVQGWAVRRRLAVLTPLPPCRSGIADYNAQFLPYLARHFDIDLFVDGYTPRAELVNASFRVFDAAGFPAVAASYDSILYEFGNSDFHVHMERLLWRHPGVVGLHDAYLSGLHRYISLSCGEPAHFRKEMLYSHGPRARRFLAPLRGLQDPDGTAVIELPGTKSVLDRADGVISHSPFNLMLARSSYPEGWLSPYRVIPQMVARVRAISASERQRLREDLGFGPDDFVVATFGHVAWTKCGDRLLEGFLRSALRDHARARLVYVGELAQDEFGAELERAIGKARGGGRIVVTGYLTEEQYIRYLRAADLAVQLRTRSRGGTPRGVLDCLSHGLAVAVNDDASYRDYPDEAVIKLAADPSADEIGAVLTRAFEEPQWRERFARSGLRYVTEHHNAAACAAAYAGAIHEFVERRRLTQPRYWIQVFAPHIAGSNDVQAATEGATAWLAALPRCRFARRRIWIDASRVARADTQTGVDRVVTQIVRAAYCTDRAGVEPVAVELRDGVLHTATAWLARQGLLLEEESATAPEPVRFAPGDVMLMLDASWGRFGEFRAAFEHARAARATIVTAIYDLLPISLPEGNIVEGGKAWFESWFRDAVAQSDALVCISRAVADEVVRYLDAHRTWRPGLRVGFWHLGGDFPSRRSDPEPDVRIAFAATQRYLLMVGTIEPRKSHATALEAMEILWQRGEDLALVVAGAEGWMMSGLMARLRNHRELGRRLFLVEQPTDDEVAAMYDHAYGLLFLSKGEGFGLPLVEAANHGVPILCSDLAVFREVAGEFATYVNAADANDLASQLDAWLRRRRNNAVPDTRAMPRLTWEQSAEALMRVIVDGHWYRQSQ